MGKDNSGAAFPVPARAHDGMTLRDWFAGQALAGMLANMDRLRIVVNYDDDQESADRKVSEQAYVHADAMLAAREAN